MAKQLSSSIDVPCFDFNRYCYMWEPVVKTLIELQRLRRITNMDKVAFALLLEEGRARASELQHHLTLSRDQIRDALQRLAQRGLVAYEPSTRRYRLL